MGDYEGAAPGLTPSAAPIGVIDLARIEDRISFLYFEHCAVNQADNAIAVTDDQGTIRIPTATLGVLMLGPGTKITHKAMTAIGDNGSTVVWVGERGVRLYAAGKPLTHSSALLQRQAALVSNRKSRLRIARMMYRMRFPGEDTSKLTMQQLRGREGARIRGVYRSLSKETGVAWDRRSYNPDDYEDGSEINKALSAAHACLYGIVHAVIVSLGCSPGLGFVHTGHERSFVYDIADLYKAELSIPVAFRTVAEEPINVGSAVRYAMRDALYDLSLMKRCAQDIKTLLCTEICETDEGVASNHVGLWDEKLGEVAAGVQYGRDDGDGGDEW